MWRVLALQGSWKSLPRSEVVYCDLEHRQAFPAIRLGYVPYHKSTPPSMLLASLCQEPHSAGYHKPAHTPSLLWRCLRARLVSLQTYTSDKLSNQSTLYTSLLQGILCNIYLISLLHSNHYNKAKIMLIHNSDAYCHGNIIRTINESNQEVVNVVLRL